MNKLYFGDNLDVMKRIYHDERQSEFIDLIYNDPPFSSKLKQAGRKTSEKDTQKKLGFLKHHNLLIIIVFTLKNVRISSTEMIT